MIASFADSHFTGYLIQAQVCVKWKLFCSYRLLVPRRHWTHGHLAHLYRESRGAADVTIAGAHRQSECSRFHRETVESRLLQYRNVALLPKVTLQLDAVRN